MTPSKRGEELVTTLSVFGKSVNILLVNFKKKIKKTLKCNVEVNSPLVFDELMDSSIKSRIQIL